MFPETVLMFPATVLMFPETVLMFPATVNKREVCRYQSITVSFYYTLPQYK